MNTVAMRGSIGSECLLEVEREGIRFRNVAARRVLVEIVVRNPEAEESAPTSLRLEAAPFGAFLPWTPVARLAVPRIPAFGSALVTTALEQAPPPTAVQHEPPRERFRRLLTAAGFGDPRRSRTPERVNPALMHIFRTLVVRNSIESGGRLPEDLSELLGTGSPHWAGNFNVLAGRRATERHMALAVRIHPGRTNAAVFQLGARNGTYELSFRGAGAAWSPRLFTLSGEGLGSRVGAQRSSGGAVLLLFRPPEWAERGKLDVVVDHRPSNDRALVEFDLDPAAAGAGCFTV